MDDHEKIEIIQINTTLERILSYHDEFKEAIKEQSLKMDNLLERLNGEEKKRLEHVQGIKDELHGRINMILFSILGGAGMFIAGIIMWLIQEKKG